MKKMKISALEFPNLTKLFVVSAIGKVAYHHETYDELFWDLINSDNGKLDVKNFLTKLIELGHESVLEHIYFTFDIQHISRWATHQLVRHRIGSFTQKSLRRKRTLCVDDFVINPTLSQKHIDRKIKRYKRAIVEYEEDLAEGEMSVDDIRADLPGTIGSEIIWTVNLRSLRNFVKLRIAHESSWEMNVLAITIINMLRAKDMAYLIEDLIEYGGTSVEV